MFFFFNFRRHHLSRRRVIPLPKTKANPITHPQALFQKDQVSGKLKCKVTHKMCVSNAMFVHITLFLIGYGRERGFTKFLICFTKKECLCLHPSISFFFFFFLGGGGEGLYVNRTCTCKWAAKGKFTQFTWVVFLVDCDGAVSSNYVFLQSRYPRTTNKGT